MENEKGREMKIEKVRESKVDVEKCVAFYQKGKWLYYYGMDGNRKTPPITIEQKEYDSPEFKAWEKVVTY